MSIDLTIPGDPRGIRAIADWLAPQISDREAEAFIELVAVRTDSEHYWTGQSGRAFRDAAISAGNASQKVGPYLSKAADVFLAYANRLERGQEDFDDLLQQALAAGLTGVRRSRIVLQPTTRLDYCPTDTAPQADLDAWRDYERRVRIYNDLSTHVGTWWGELEAWLAEHMAPLVAQVNDFAAVDDFLARLSVGNEDVVQAGLDAAEFNLGYDFTEWSAVQNRMQADADLYTRGLRSGNPALRAASEKANPRAIRQGLRALSDEIVLLQRAAKIVGGVGIAGDVVLAAIAVSQGDSLSSNVVEVLGGIAGGAGVGGAIAAFGGPPGWVLGGVIVGGVVIGELARWGYEAWVPLNVRETIDDFFLGSPPVLVNEATGTWAVGVK